MENQFLLLAETNYNAYKDSVKGVAMNGDKMLSFIDLTLNIKNAWGNSAKAIYELKENDCSKIEKLSKKNDTLEYSLDVQRLHYEHLITQKIENLECLKKEIKELQCELCEFHDTDSDTDDSKTETNYTDSSNCSRSENTSDISCLGGDDKKMLYIEMLENFIKLNTSIHANAYKNINDDSFHDAMSSLNDVGKNIARRTFPAI